MPCLSLNPMATTNALGPFGVQPDDYVQGIAPDDLANRFNLSSGTVAATETKPLWGDLPVAEPLPGNQSSLRGSTVRRTVSVTGLEGFTVFNQAHNGLTTPQPPAPLYAPGMSVPFYRLGSNMRVPLETSAQVIMLATSDASVRTALVWDFVSNQTATVAAAGFVGADIATITLAYASGVATTTTASAHGLMAGQYVKVSSIAPSAYNGAATTSSVPSAATFTCTPVTAPGSTAITQGIIGMITLSDTTLPVKAPAVETGDSKTVTYNDSTGFLAWNNNDSHTLVLL